MNKMKIKAILFTDNCCADKINKRLENIGFHFLPPNATTILQPVDQRIISLFNRNYRKEVVKKIITSIDDTSGIFNNSSTSKIMGSISILKLFT